MLESAHEGSVGGLRRTAPRFRAVAPERLGTYERMCGISIYR
jgi:hypothetical protein